MTSSDLSASRQDKMVNSRSGSWRMLLPGLLLALAVLAGITLQLSQRVASRMLQREGAVAQELLQSVIIAENSQDKLFREPSPDPALVSFANHVGNLAGILRANIYSPDGFIRHSSEANLVGLKFSDNPELAHAFAGKITVNLEKITAEEKGEHMALGSYSDSELIEAYIPLRDSTGKVFAVVEYYKKPQDVAVAISEVNRIIWVAAAMMGLVLCILWAWLVWHGHRLMATGAMRDSA